VADRRQAALTEEEPTGITLAVQSAFTKLKNLYRETEPIFRSYGFTDPSTEISAFLWRLNLYRRATTILVPGLLTLHFPKIARFVAPIEARGCESGARTVLIVSYYAPPWPSNLGTQRAAKFAKYLSAAGWKVLFVTTTPQTDNEIDEHCEAIAEAVEVVHVEPGSRHPFHRPGLLPPDDYVFDIPRLADAIARIVSGRSVDAILATIPPYSVAVAAALVAVRTGVPLVTDFRDPWTKIDRGLGWTLPNSFLCAISAALERGVLAISSRVIMTSERRYFDDYFPEGSQWGLPKTVSIRNGFDDDDFVADVEASNDVIAGARADAFVISYVGSLYNGENVDNIRRMFEAFASRHPVAGRRVRFQYAGAQGTLLHRRGPWPIPLTDHGFVTHGQSNSLRMRSHVQLFALPGTFGAHISTGKIFEMIRVGVPILAIARARSAVSRLVAQTRTGVTFSPDESDKAADALKRMFDEWETNHRVSFDPDLGRIQAYSRKSLCGQLSAVLAAVTGRPTDGSRSAA